MEDYKTKYDKLHRFVNDLYPHMSDYCKEKVEGYFPELKENEDERIRKNCIHFLELQKEHHAATFEIEECIAWLEKQKERSPLTTDEMYTLQRIIEYLEDDGCPQEWKDLLNDIYSLPFQKQGEQKPVEWSAYDKATLEYIIEDIKELCDNETEEGSIETYNRELNLLQAINKSIKLSSYTNPAAWSEEDKKLLNLSLENLTELKNRFGEKYGKVGDCILWLKSIKERYTWKPSDEQMEAFEHFVRSVGESGYASPYNNNTKLLYSLLQQLKKLKEE